MFQAKQLLCRLHLGANGNSNKEGIYGLPLQCRATKESITEWWTRCKSKGRANDRAAHSTCTQGFQGEAEETLAETQQTENTQGTGAPVSPRQPSQYWCLFQAK